MVLHWLKFWVKKASTFSGVYDGIAEAACKQSYSAGKRLTYKSNFCKHLLHGEVILAYCGFDVAEMVALSGSVFYIPSFTKGKAQLSATEVHETKKK